MFGAVRTEFVNDFVVNTARNEGEPIDTGTSVSSTHSPYSPYVDGRVLACIYVISHGGNPQKNENSKVSILGLTVSKLDHLLVLLHCRIPITW